MVCVSWAAAYLFICESYFQLQDLSEKEKRQVRDAVRVAERMLCVYPHERPSCKELLQDRFFTDETSGEALRTTPAQKLKAVAVDITSRSANGTL